MQPRDAIIPDACRDDPRRAQMRGIACEVVHDATRLHRHMAVFLLSSGEVKRTSTCTALYRSLFKRYRLNLVGIYTDEADIERITDDLMCMERVH